MIGERLRRRLTRRGGDGNDGPPEMLIPRLLDLMAAAEPEARFIEIGANDGQQHDHLLPLLERTDWRGVMVEPVPHIFDRLERLHGANPRIDLRRAVVAAEDGEVSFWSLRPAEPGELADLPDWYDGIGSLERDHLLAHREQIPDIEERLVGDRLHALSFETLLTGSDLGRLDLLVIDVEGYDWELLGSIDLRRHRPAIVIHEHFHLSARDRAESHRFLRGAGYLPSEEGFDTVSVHEEAPAAVLEAARSGRPGVAGVYAEQERAR